MACANSESVCCNDRNSSGFDKKCWTTDSILGCWGDCWGCLATGTGASSVREPREIN